MDKKTFKRRCKRLWAATEIWLCDGGGYSLAKEAEKPLAGKSIRKLLGDGMYEFIGTYQDNVISVEGWTFEYPKFNNKRMYTIRIEEDLYEPGRGNCWIRVSCVKG